MTSIEDITIVEEEEEPHAQGSNLPIVPAAEVIDEAFQMLYGRWKMPILYHLFGSEVCRFSELQRSIPGVTQKVLAQQLRGLEADGLVLRTLYPEIPPKVEYSLTPWGQSLEPALSVLARWAKSRPSRTIGS